MTGLGQVEILLGRNTKNKTLCDIWNAQYQICMFKIIFFKKSSFKHQNSKLYNQNTKSRFGWNIDESES